MLHIGMELSVAEKLCTYSMIIEFVGYANEVGESFRALIHVNWVRFSYVVSSSYVCADAASKGSDASKVATYIFVTFLCDIIYFDFCWNLSHLISLCAHRIV